MSQPTHHSLIVTDAPDSVAALNALYAQGYTFVAACAMPSSPAFAGGDYNAYRNEPISSTCLVTLRTPPTS